ncbi:MAG TPA: gluconate 2-dehydrogenase subunit 3 family protein, partial [Candidatus Sulfopaludibacter sp.]|nr:gluconate 2-dehydrogenase subunit 3 family protein [Candidatus Sulfopaludibacter sp.]
MSTIPSRREMLSTALRASALPGAAGFFAGWLKAADDHNHSTAPPEPPFLRDYQSKFFDAADFAALQAFTEILIPTDDTPGAREAHCAHYIDFVLQASPEPAQKQWRDAMVTLRELGFHSAGEKARAALVEAISQPERDRTATHPGFAAYRLIKQ